MGFVSSRPMARRSRNERRVTYALKVLSLIALGAIMLSATLDFIGRISAVAVIVIGAVFFTYVIFPVVRRLNMRLPLVWSVTIVYLAIAAVAAFAVSVIVPALIDDTQQLVKAMPSLVHSAQAFLTDSHNPIIRRLPAPVRTYLAQVPAQVAALAQAYAGQAASRALTLALSVVGIVATVIVIPVMSAYMIFEAPELIRAFLRALPPRAQPEALAVLRDLDKVLGGFIRGQLTVGATIGVFITIALLILHVKYAVLIGVTAGLLDVIPYVGALVGFVPSVTLAFFNDGWQHALIVAAVFAGIFQAEGHFIAPRIVSNSVGLSPLMVIIAILIGGELLGISGMFIAVPIAAALRVILLRALPNVRAPQPSIAVAQPAVDAAGDALAAPAVPVAKKAQGART